MNNKQTIKIEAIYSRDKRIDEEIVERMVELDSFAKIGYHLYKNKEELPIKITESIIDEKHLKKSIELTLCGEEEARETGYRSQGSEFIDLNTKVKFQKNKIRELESSIQEKDFEIKKLKGLLAEALLEKDLCKNLLDTIFEVLEELEEEALKEMPKEQAEKFKRDEKELMDFFKSLRK